MTDVGRTGVGTTDAGRTGVARTDAGTDVVTEEGRDPG